jgi:hypothetical protein
MVTRNQLIYFVKADLMYTANNFLWDIYTQIFGNYADCN